MRLSRNQAVWNSCALSGSSFQHWYTLPHDEEGGDIKDRGHGPDDQPAHMAQLDCESRPPPHTFLDGMSASKKEVTSVTTPLPQQYSPYL